MYIRAGTRLRLVRQTNSRYKDRCAVVIEDFNTTNQSLIRLRFDGEDERRTEYWTDDVDGRSRFDPVGDDPDGVP